MLLQLDFHGGTPIYRQIVDQIRRLAITGVLREGDPVAHVRTLAKELKVNPMTVSRAYSQLEQNGILERRRGVGMFVAPIKTRELQRMRMDLINQAMERAASQAIQAGLTRDEATKAFEEQFAKTLGKQIGKLKRRKKKP